MSHAVAVHTLTLLWALPGKRIPTGMATFGCLTVVGSLGHAPVDRLNKQGGAASQSFGVLLITFNV